MQKINRLKNKIFYILNLCNLVLPKERAAILLYHNIVNNDVHFSVHPERFAEQMKFLKDNEYKVISLNELVENIKTGKRTEAKTVVLTFDDGYRGHLVNVLPVIKKYNFPATFFVITDFNKKELGSDGGKMQELLSEQDVVELSLYENATVDPHSVSHKELSWVSCDEAEKEIRQSKLVLEKLLNKKCQAFAYPRGYYNNNVVKMLKEAGIECAVTVNQGLVSRNSNLYELPRNTINNNAGLDEFKGCLNYSSIIFECLTNIRKFLRRFKKK